MKKTNIIPPLCLICGAMLFALPAALAASESNSVENAAVENIAQEPASQDDGETERDSLDAAVVGELGLRDVLRDSIEPVPFQRQQREQEQSGQNQDGQLSPEELESRLHSKPAADEDEPGGTVPVEADADSGPDVEQTDPDLAIEADESPAPDDGDSAPDDSVAMPEVEDLKSNELRDLFYEALYDVQDELFAEAIPKLEHVIATDPTLTGAWEALGWAYWNTGRKEETEQLWKRFQALDPEHPLPYVLLAALALEDGDLAEGRRLYREALAKEPDQSFASRMFNVRFSYARLIYWDGQVASAIEMMEELLAEDPMRTDVSLALARAYLRRGDYAQALPLWTALREMAAENAEFIASEALCLLHTGQPELAAERAEIAIEIEPGNPRAIEVLIAAALFGDNPEDALPYLRELYRQTDDPAARDRVRQQIIRIRVYLHRLDPRKYGLAEAIRLSRERLDENEDSIDSILLLAELLLMDDKLQDSQGYFERVVEEFNPYNLRARRGLFEVFLSRRKYSDARLQYEYIRRFDPANMYLFYYLARLESTRGSFYKAHDMLEKLEEAGRRGAVPILLYSPLTDSEFFEERIPAKRIEEHLAALEEHRFRLMGPLDLPDFFSGSELQPWWEDKTVIVTFDQVDRSSMEVADRYARSSGSVFSAHIPVADVEDSAGDSCSWAELREYQSSGYWSFGSALMNPSARGTIDYKDTQGNPLANRLWFKDQGSEESTADYVGRIENEFVESQRIIQSHLGEQAGRYVAYPRGDIGQNGYSNLETPFAAIVQTALANYDFGFVQSQFGYAVNGGNPLLYQRYRVNRWDTGDDLIRQIYDNHPVFLALATRAKYAAFQGRQYLALDLLDQLEELGYPEKLHAEVDEFVRDRLSRRLAAPMDVGSVSEGPLHLKLRDPYAGVQFNYFEDSLDRENWSAYLEGGLNVSAGLALEAKVGIGELKQKVRAFDHPRNGEDLSFDEDNLGAKAVYTFPNGLYLSAEGINRDYSGKDGDNSVTAYTFETQFRPILAADIMLSYAHDMEPSALAVLEDITYDQLMGVGIFRIRDWWDASAAAIRYDYSDDNTRDHLQLGTRVFVWPRTGLNLGFKYAYTDADEERVAYWTPHKLHRYFIEPGFQGTYLRAYYDVRLRLGLGRESVRPETKDAYEEGLRRASEGGYEPFRSDEPSEDWEPVFGVSASWDIPVSKYWYFNGRLGYNESPNYDEFRAHVGLKLKL